MKMFLSISFAISALAFLSSCEKFSLEPRLEPVGGCVDLPSYQVISEVGRTNGSVRQISVWVPIDENRRDFHNLQPEELKQIDTWVIIPDQNSNTMFEPCNLPSNFRVNGMRIVFEGSVMNRVEEKPYSGTTDFQLRGILNDDKPAC